VTNGAVRDLPAVEAMGFQLFAAYVSPSHSYAHIIEFGEPVEIDGLQIASGDLLHADRHGVVEVPLSIAAKIRRRQPGFLTKNELSSASASRATFPLKVCPITYGTRARIAISGGYRDRLDTMSRTVAVSCTLAILAFVLGSCGSAGSKKQDEASNPDAEVSVGVTKAGRQTLERTLSLSSELVPFQEVDVYARSRVMSKTEG